MVLSEQQKKDLVERLRAGREKKAQEKGEPKKTKKTASEPEPEPVAIVATKVEKPKRQPAKKVVEIKPDPEEYTIQTRDIPDSESDSEPEPIDEPVQKQQERPMTIKEKRLNKNKPKYMAIKFYREPNPELYKNIMSSIQPTGELPTRYTWDNHPSHPVKITDEEKQETARRIAEIKQKEEEQKMRDAIYRLIG